MYKIYILIWMGVIALALGVGWYFYSFKNSAELDISLSYPESIAVGIPFVVKVGVSNMGNNVLNEAKISLSLGEGMAFWGAPSSKNSDTKSIGSIGSGSMIETSFEVIILGGENASSTKKVVATASYLPQGISSSFEKIQESELKAASNGLLLDLVMPEKVGSGEEFSFLVKYKNISDVDLRDLKLVLDYPAGFEFKKATLLPDIGKNIWNLGDLRKGSEMEFKIIGNVLGNTESDNQFGAKVISNFFGDSYVIALNRSGVEIVASPLEVNISLNDSDSELILGTDENLRYKISYVNKTDRGLEDAIISAQLSGDMFDFSSVKTNGIISPTGHSIAWNRVTNSELGAISMGGSGQVSFEVKTKNAYPINRLSDKNFILKIKVKLESGIAGSGGVVVGVDELESKIRGNIAVATKVYFRDAESGILNKGSVPPRVGMPINYTVHWIVTNYATDVNNVNLQAILGEGVRYTGVSKTSTNTDLIYNSTSNAVSWHIDRISATRGLVDRPLELIFQVEAIPSASRVGNVITLIGPTSITAKDDFTGLDLWSNNDGVTSAVEDDITVGIPGGVVVQ